VAPCAHWSLCFRCKSAGGHRKWPDAAGPKRAREGLQPNQQTAVPADGCTRGLECPRDNIRYTSHPSSHLLLPNVGNKNVEIRMGILQRMVELLSYLFLLLTGKFPLPTGKKNKLRVYYLSWLRNRILHNDPEVEKKQGWITVGDLEGCIHYKVGEWPRPPCCR